MQYFYLADNEEFKLFWWDDKSIEGETIYCSKNKGHRRAGKRLSDLTVIPKSRRCGDMMWTVYSDCLINENMANAFRHSGLSGYNLRKVKMSSAKSRMVQLDEVPKFWELKVLGWGGMAHPESGIRLKEKCDACGLLVYTDFNNPSKLLDESQWDGSDFFMIWPLPRFIFVTERVMEIIKYNGFRRCDFISPEELPYGPDNNPIGDLCPGRLRLWMPEKRARKLGEPLGIY